jgi:hypothetical protein
MRFLKLLVSAKLFFLAFFAGEMQVNSQNLPVCEQAAFALEKASELRQLKVLRPASCISANKKEFETFQREHVQALTTDRDLKDEGDLYRLLGLIPDTFDYEHCVVEGSREYIQAFYHSTRHAVIVPDWQSISFDVLVHESVHVLQDQHFNLSKMAKEAFVSTDKALAFAALIEGDAKNIQALIPAPANEEQVHEEKTPGSCELPATILDQDFFPYSFGRFFVERLNKQGGYKAINNAFLRPPTSTAEIIHRDKYFDASVKPVASKMSRQSKTAAKSSDLNEVHYDTLGQYTIRLILGQALDMQRSVLSSKGWLYDKAVLFRNSSGTKQQVSWETFWENPEEAKEFFESFRIVLEKRYSISLRAHAKSLLVQPRADLQFRLSLEGSAVYFDLIEIRITR